MDRFYINSVRLKETLPKSSYLASLPAIKALQSERELAFRTPVTFFVGENGTGKSTLLEAIAVGYGFNAEGGSRNFRFSTNDTHSSLYRHLVISKQKHPRDGFFLRAESLYNVATNIEQLDAAPSFDGPVTAAYGGTSLHRMSHGESFLSIIQNRFFGRGLYLLDEPEAALSPSRLLALLCEIRRLEKQDSQCIIATHSPILMAYPNATVYEFSAQGIEEKPYWETDHWRISQRFLKDPQSLLEQLLKEDPLP
ncbi:MAG: AAA family ATPase [Clostridia bacterium]|nr:AAA family ATPase [Clostridia bacterium]